MKKTEMGKNPTKPTMGAFQLTEGMSAEMMQPMAMTMVGGLIYGTILTLIVIPCVYDAFTKEKNMVEEEL